MKFVESAMIETVVMLSMLGIAWLMRWVWSWPLNDWAPWHDWDFRTWYLVALTFTLSSVARRVYGMEE